MASDRYIRTSNSIAEFCRALNFQPSSQQADLLAAAHNATFDIPGAKRAIAARSGQGVGKTTASVVIGLWRAWRAFDAKTFVTAPTMRQCTQVWLSEAAKRIEVAEPWVRDRIRVTGSRIIIGNRPGMWGVSFFTATKPENAQGLHNDHMTVICEEASGIPRPLIEQIDGTIKNKDWLWLQIGNPNSRTSAFYDCFTKDADRWAARVLSARLSPFVDQIKLEAQIRRYGPKSDFVRVRIDGDFPNRDPDAIVELSTLTAAAARNMRAFSMSNLSPRAPKVQIALDFARFGNDLSCIAVRLGSALFHMETFEKTDPNVVLSHALQFQKRMRWPDDEVVYVPDATGMGQSLIYPLLRAGKRVFEFNATSSPVADDSYNNLGTEAYFNMRNLLAENRIHILDDSDLFQQLTTRKYWLDRDGLIVIEDKDDFKKREGISPDKADAVTMCFCPIDSGAIQIGGGRGHASFGAASRRVA